MLENPIQILNPDPGINGEFPLGETIFDGSGVLPKVKMKSRFGGGGSGKGSEIIITVGDVPPNSRALEIVRILQNDGAGLAVVSEITPVSKGEGKQVNVATTPQSKN